MRIANCERGKKRGGVGAGGFLRFAFFALAAGIAFADELPPAPRGEPLPLVEGVERQPLMAATDRLIEAMRHIGAPLPKEAIERIEAARAEENDAKCVAAIQEALDALCLIGVHINPESRVKVARGPAPAELVERGWRAFLVKVHNEAGVTARLDVESPHALPSIAHGANLIDQDALDERWMAIGTFDAPPMNERLSGLKVEYRIVQIHSVQAGRREATIAFNVGQGTQDIGFRNDVAILFHCRPAVKVSLGVLDENARPTMASFVVKDEHGRVYPHSNKRLEPDFFFHDQVYRGDGESLELPPGKYTFAVDRGPEYNERVHSVEVLPVAEHRMNFRLDRWIDPNRSGWYSGDHHIHAAGCLHYHSPTIGVTPESMMRHVLGEGLNVGCVLTWGPGWYHQKNYFTGDVHESSGPTYLVRYDIEISGFPSDPCGHLVLLRLKEDDYPGTEEKHHWPTWNLPILKWAKEQGGVTGVAHSGWGLDVWPEDRLPNHVVPPMNGIGAQEFLVDLAHDAIDFLSAGDTPYVWELNMWYHTLNCGFRPRISGETDFPCIYGDRVGMARSYVKMGAGAVDRLDFDEWVRGMQAGRSYVSDGLSHLLEFQVDGVGPGGTQSSELKLERPGYVRVKVVAAALLEPEPAAIAPRGTRSMMLSENPASRAEKVRIRDIPYNQMPYWHVERARVGETRRVPVEIVVNGEPAAAREIEADGAPHELEFEIHLPRSAWVAARILPSSHTNPVFVVIGDKPIRASRRSAIWCLKGIDKVWEEKSPRFEKTRDLPAALEAFAQAREVYRRILAESHDDMDSLGFELAKGRSSYGSSRTSSPD